MSSEEAITTLVIEYALHRIMSKPKITREKNYKEILVLNHTVEFF